MTTLAETTTAAPTVRVEPRARNAAIIAWTLAVLFVTAAAELNIVTLTWVRVGGREWPQPGWILMIALSFAQTGLVALACGLGRQHLALRAWMFVCTAAITGFYLSRGGEESRMGTLMVMLFFYGILVLTGTWLLQLRGWRLVLAHEQQQTRQPPWQFSVANLFATTTCAALLLGILRYVQIEQEELLLDMVVSGILAVIPLGVGYLMLTRQRPALVILGIFGVVLATTFAFVNFTGDYQDYQSAVFAFFLMLFTSLLVFGALVIVRLAGYHLVRGNGKG
ncbi:hypothetical protein [Anatilimnocola aggregata]|uniref:hypothetical protein n=1 Tax=Anatilimnocola aggregata TaxID=2528021 RepID=UPI0011A545D7|nr:hypothetical protein [Anatilimnocola aggregata]